MYVDDCDTGSQPRKAISHIFGRNKLCTRMIPQHVWVHFCRKHYQRSRYRNAQEYAKVQCELVEKQVGRVQSWSDENRQSGQGGVVVDWSLSMRKREQNRVSEKSHKRRPSGQESSDDGGMDRAVLNGTAVPDWLRNKVGDGYSTTEIEEIVARLKDEVEENHLTQIPDIEILPNITDIQDGGRNKATLKRKASTSTTHQRSQSGGNSLYHESPPVTRRNARPNHDNPEEVPWSSLTAKRRRIHDSLAQSERSGFTRPEVHERAHHHTTMPPLTPFRQYPTSPMDRDNRLDSYAGPTGRSSFNQSVPSLNPTSPQRAPYYYPRVDHSDVRRPSHVRSRSDIYNNPGYAHYPTEPEYQQYPHSYDTSPSTYERSYMTPNHPPAPTTSYSGYYDQYQPSIPPIRSSDTQSFWNPSASHGRHQSSPALQGNMPLPRHQDGSPNQHHPMPFPPAPEHNTVPSLSRPTDNYGYQPYNSRRQESFTPQRQYSRRPTVEESEKTKAIYSERR